MRSEHTPDVGSALFQKGEVGVPSGRAAAAGSLTSGTSLPHMQFRDVKGTVRYFQLLGHCIPDNFVETLCSVVVVSEEHNFIVSGDVLADSLVSAVVSRNHRSCSLIDLLYHALGTSSGSPIIASSLGGVCQLDEVGSLGA